LLERQGIEPTTLALISQSAPFDLSAMLTKCKGAKVLLLKPVKEVVQTKT